MKSLGRLLYGLTTSLVFLSTLAVLAGCAAASPDLAKLDQDQIVFRLCDETQPTAIVVSVVSELGDAQDSVKDVWHIDSPGVGLTLGTELTPALLPEGFRTVLEFDQKSVEGDYRFITLSVREADGSFSWARFELSRLSEKYWLTSQGGTTSDACD